MKGSIVRYVVGGGLVLLLLAGCDFLLGRTRIARQETSLRIVVSPSGTRGISSEEVDVTSLDLSVTGGSFVYEVTWVPADGMQQYDISLPGAGSYQVEATHHGVSTEGPVSASETETVLVQPLVISVVTIIPGQILTVLVANLPTGRFDEARWDQAVFGP